MDNDDIPEAVLCKVCTSIFAENSYERWSRFWQIWQQIHDRPWQGCEPDLPFPGRHHRSLQKLKDAKIQGCQVCSWLCENEWRLKKASFPLKYRLEIDLCHKTTPRGDSRYWLSIEGWPRFRIKNNSSQSALQKSAIRSNYRVWTGHEDFAVLARAWVDNCLKNHAICSRPLSPGWKPSRLLDICQDDIKLVLRESGEAQGPYVTLSHCWGTDKFLVLTADLLPRFLHGVHISEFPLTFQETIITVRRLGIQYLWIDCYCILQGDNDEARVDWKHQSLYMRQIYTNSLLNIGALDSKNPFEGLFKYRPSTPVSAKILWSPTRRDGPVLPRLAPRDEYSLYLHGKGLVDIFQNGLPNSALMKRGWVLQECVLAPRMLSFGKQDVFWQCSQLAACNQYPDKGKIELEEYSSMQAYSPFWMLKDPVAVNRLSVQGIKAKWISTLDFYCISGRLTYPEKDVLVALDGIGEELAKLSGSQFRYGMLASTFPEALLWVVDDQDRLIRSKTKPTKPAKPSWHWSSSYPKAGHTRVGMLYGQRRISFFPMAYGFMSSDCKPLPNEFSGDYWPNILLVGRLMTELPRFTRISLDAGPCRLHTAKNYFTSSDQAPFYLPLISTGAECPLRKKDGTGELCRRNRRRRSCRTTFWGLILEQSESGVYRRTGIWVAYDDGKFHTRILGVQPRLIVLE